MGNQLCPYKHRCTHGIIKQRRKRKLEFAITYKELILAADYEMKKNNRKHGFCLKLSPLAALMVMKLKEEIDYSCRKVEWDIFSSLVRLLTRYLKTQNTQT